LAADGESAEGGLWSGLKIDLRLPQASAWGGPNQSTGGNRSTSSQIDRPIARPLAQLTASPPEADFGRD